jgi:hypothetical protein
VCRTFATTDWACITTTQAHTQKHLSPRCPNSSV